MAETLLSRSQVEARTGFKRSAIYARIAAGTFPAPIREPDTGTVRWLESDVDQWVANFIARSVKGGTMVGSRATNVQKAA